jgi:hypothetical protein
MPSWSRIWKSGGWIELTIFSCFPALALDLIPLEQTRTFEGARFRQWSFEDGAARVTYDPPTGWSFADMGSANRLVLILPEGRLASAEITQQKLQAPVQFTSELIDAVKREIVTNLPAGAEAPEIVQEDPNPLQIDGKNTFEIRVAFMRSGSKCMKNVLILLTETSQIKFELSVAASDFARLYRVFRSSWYTWSWRSAGGMR